MRLRTVIMLLPFLTMLACAVTPAAYSLLPASTAAFDEGRAIPGYRYYFNGPEAEPAAILAIREGVDFDETLWNPVPDPAAMLPRWSRQIQNEYRVRSRYFSYEIIAPDGQPIGLWYSLADRPSVWILVSGKLAVSTPNIIKVFRRNDSEI